MKKIIIAIVVMILISATALGAIYFKKIYSGSGNIGGDSTEFKTEEKSSQEYLELIDQYTKEINDLKVKLAEITTKYDTDITAKQSQIIDLQKELLELKQTDEALINEKNAKIAELEAQIVTLQNEKEEASKKDKEQIEQLETKVNDCEFYIANLLPISEDIVNNFNGLSALDNESLLLNVASTSNYSYYYYNIKTQETKKILENASILGFSVRKIENLIFFVNSVDICLYVYDLSNDELTSLGEFSYGNFSHTIAYTYDNDNVYIFGSTYSFCIFNRKTKTVKITNNKFGYETTIYAYSIDNYVVVAENIAEKNGTPYNFEILLFDKNSCEFINILNFNTQTYSKTFLCEMGIIENDFIVLFQSKLYKLDIAQKTLEKIYTFASGELNYYKFLYLDNKLVIITKNATYLYKNGELVNLGIGFSDLSRFSYTRINENTYYICYYSSGLLKLDLENETLTQVLEMGTYYSEFEIDDYKIIYCSFSICVIDIKTGNYEEFSIFSSLNENAQFDRLYKLKFENYLIFSCYFDIYNSAFDSILYPLFYYNTTLNKFGLLGDDMFQNEVAQFGCKIGFKNNKLFVLTSSNLFIFNSDNLSNPTTTLNVVSSLCSLTRGIFYSKVGEMDGSSIYVKYTLQDDGTFLKELAVI